MGLGVRGKQECEDRSKKRLIRIEAEVRRRGEG